MRIELLDILRGISIIAMIIFHGHYLLVHVFDLPHESALEGFWRIFGIIVATTFITLSGYVNALGQRNRTFQVILYKAFRRSFLLASIALGISLVTYIFIPEQRISWGIIHFFALASFMQVFFARLKEWVFLIALFVYFLGGIFSEMTFSTSIFIPFGIMSPGYYSADYYPFFPWFSFILLGQGISFLLEKYGIQNWLKGITFPNFKILAFLGRYSLLVYVIHTPILYGIFSLLAFVL